MSAANSKPKNSSTNGEDADSKNVSTKFSQKSAILIAAIGAITSIAVAWITANASAKPAANKALDDRTIEVQAIESDLSTIQQRLDTDAIRTATLPRGTIVAWHSSSGRVPNGWAICNGDNGTPNLVGQFLRGVGTQKESGIDPDASPSHSHALTITNTLGTVSYTTDKGNDSIGVREINHAHESTMTKASNLPPNFRTVFIMKL